MQSTDDYIQFVVIRREQQNEYRRHMAPGLWGHLILLLLPETLSLDMFGQTGDTTMHDGIGYARLFIQQFAHQVLKAEYIWMMDDNVVEFRKLNLDAMELNQGHTAEHPPIPCTMREVVEALEDIMRRPLGQRQIAVIGTRRQWTNYMLIRRPFAETLSVYSMFLLNVKATVASGLYYLPRLVHEDIHFNFEAHNRGLIILKCNRFFHLKVDLQARRTIPRSIGLITPSLAPLIECVHPVTDTDTIVPLPENHIITPNVINNALASWFEVNVRGGHGQNVRWRRNDKYLEGIIHNDSQWDHEFANVPGGSVFWRQKSSLLYVNDSSNPDLVRVLIEAFTGEPLENEPYYIIIHPMMDVRQILHQIMVTRNHLIYEVFITASQEHITANEDGTRCVRYPSFGYTIIRVQERTIFERNKKGKGKKKE